MELAEGFVFIIAGLQRGRSSKRPPCPQSSRVLATLMATIDELSSRKQNGRIDVGAHHSVDGGDTSAWGTHVQFG